ncbi:MAG: hypothetical protein EB032_09165, partial [Betaproteobacteria bacterium]|nr:hypothetical protein [Betaproteobacteria bacterium]
MIVSDMHLPSLRLRDFNRLVVGLLAMGLSAGMSFAQMRTPTTPTQTPKVLILGDSLSAEYGLTRGTGWVDQMAQQAQRESVAVQLINASISGDTTSGGVTRLP